MIFDGLQRFVNRIFITIEGEKDVFTAIKTDFNLSRSLYVGYPIRENEQESYQLGNFCTKTFINTFSWYVGIPEFSSANNEFTESLNSWVKRGRSKLLAIIQQALVDGKHYVWLRVEESPKGPIIVIRQIQRELVNEKESERDMSGGYKKLVFSIKEQDKDGHALEIQWTLEPKKESWKLISGTRPAYLEKDEGENAINVDFVPVFCQVNNKQTYIADGIPEIAPAVPFIQRYDQIMRKLGRHISDGLIPRMIFRITSGMNDFLKLSFSLTDEQLKQGGVKVSPEQFQSGFLSGQNDEIKYLQKEDRSPAAMKMLELLYFIIIELTMPEYLYGAAMNSTNASVSEQSPVWAKKVDGKQGEFDEFFYWLADTYLAMMNAESGREMFRDVGNVEVKWPEVTVKDDVALMNAFASLMTALGKAMELNLVSPDTAFNALKQFIPVSGTFDEEKNKALAFTKLRLEIDEIREKLREGDTDVGDRINALFGKGAKK